ncbi:MAG: hypothetical protein CBC29_03560 [Methylococcaceae bacterium TMED69]|nr:MAG: hypothetical protein CBC29_03560 [Methylococcaceae bacterium TMED69]
MKDNELLRYSRHILLPQIDIEGQEKINSSKAVLIGLGGLGSVISMYLASSGIGRIVLIDHDEVEISNLQRQIIFQTEDIGKKKALIAQKFLQKLNPLVKIDTCIEKVQKCSTELIQDANVFIDASDNFETRFFLNELSLKNKIPLVSGAAVRFEGQISVFNLKPDSPCYHCLFDSSNFDLEDNCSTNGILSPLLGVIASMQVIETLKIIADFGTTLDGRLLLYDSQLVEWTTLKLKKDPDCNACKG